MSLIGRPFDGEMLPIAYGGCHCSCHRMPGVKHVMACCFPQKTLPQLQYLKDWSVDLRSYGNDIIHFRGTSQYSLCSTFVRMQEFYESPYPEIRGKYFTLDRFQDVYAANSGGIFSYYEDWAGFNIPGNVVNEFFKVFSRDLNQKEYDIMRFVEHHEIANVLRGPNQFYIIGTYKEDSINHELAHALYYLSAEDYRVATHSIFEKVPDYIKNTMISKLTAMGYTENVFEDEIQAYLSTGTYAYLKKHFGLSKAVLEPWTKQYRKIFKNYSTTCDVKETIKW